jgi:hypothetical protein
MIWIPWQSSPLWCAKPKPNDTLFGRTILPSHSFEPLFKNEATSSLGTARISKLNANKDGKATCNLALAKEWPADARKHCNASTRETSDYLRPCVRNVTCRYENELT